MRRVHIRRKTAVQLAVLAVITVAVTLVLTLQYIRLPEIAFGAGHYEVSLQLPEAGGLYSRSNVTYLGAEVGDVKDLRLTDTGVVAVLSLKSSVAIPSDVDAEVHSQTSVGEQYVELIPRNTASPRLASGDTISRARASVPPDINSELDAVNRGLAAIPQGNLKTVIDESYNAFGGMGPDIARLVKGSTTLAIDARQHLGELTNLADNSAPLLDTQTDTSDAVRSWAAHLAGITTQFQAHDKDVRGILHNGPSAADQTRQLLDRLNPTLPVLFANLTQLAPVLVTYRNDLEQLLVLVPLGVQTVQASAIGGKDTQSTGLQLNFNLNVNLPRPCSTGFLPPQQIRSPSAVDSPDRPAGDLYCRTPQDSQFNVRGARNIPCETRPGKRAPTVKMCESDENFVPLNDGNNWKGDPNATVTGQDVPQLSPDPSPAPGPDPAAAPPPVAVAQYDSATGRYVGPDGKVYTQENLSPSASRTQTWQSMLVPSGTA